MRQRRSLVRNLIFCALGHSNTLLGEGLINFSMVILKVPEVSEFLRLGSSLFHSIIVAGKKEFFKKLSLILSSGKFAWFLAT